MSEQTPQPQPSVAPGLEDDELHREATDSEKAAGDTTKVTTMSVDENDNGSQESPNS
ncbi:hypothetical protein [Tumebacillus permanentifrigoris]|uniref:Uncharacterized protein n=1 Tax=Tumebacillus permanentifrigoris TaxID=378543 RepID=A0A316DAG2_9BACL|nr:hypothetical protein [Tumebacillus permanentifrigoris]PWK13802.1 hypothetical protein C7459_10682 [Tumebacillus permanentifrigoris]